MSSRQLLQMAEERMNLIRAERDWLAALVKQALAKYRSIHDGGDDDLCDCGCGASMAAILSQGAAAGGKA